MVVLEGINAIKAYCILGRMYTIVYFDPHGYPEQRCFKLQTISYKPYGDHENPCLLVVEGNAQLLKWEKFIRLYDGKQFILWEGNWKVDTARVVSRGLLDSSFGHVMCEKQWPHMDSRYLHKALHSVKQLPIALCVKDVEGPERLITYQCISERN